MGLDMYAYRTPTDDGAVDSGIPNEREPIAYWRKFNHLHGWMNGLYIRKGGKDEMFNCSTVRVDREDIEELEEQVKRGLKHTPGFFFGGPDIWPDQLDALAEFVVKARKALDEGDKVYYYSWW